MMNSTNTFKKLAIAGAVSAAMLGATAAHAGSVSYHMNPISTPPNGEAPNVNGGGLGPAWSNGSPAALGYGGNLPVTWLADIDQVNTDYGLSAADAIANHGAGSTFVLQSANNKWTPASSWGNALDYGLINLQVGGDLVVTVEADTSLSSTFAPGFTLWSGWDQGFGNKHQAWNANPNAPTPLGATGLTYKGHAATTTDGGSVTYTFTGLTAGQYTLFIGGNGSNNSNEYYKANLKVAAVPIPAAVWLFGSALAGMGIIGRRRDKALA